MNGLTPEREVQFLVDLQRLLSEGQFTATYKYALLMALADLSVECGEDSDLELEISSRQLADKFVRYYWRQCAPYPVAGLAEMDESVFRQNSDRQAAIINLVRRARADHQGSLSNAMQDSQAWGRLLSRVGGVVRDMPLWRLQTVGGEQLEFLYQNVGRGGRITLKPGVAACFRKFHGLVTELVHGAWARYIRRFNPGMLGDVTDLREFLFGGSRNTLSAAAPILREAQEGRCFYCRAGLAAGDVDVDHFIPWSRYPVDLGHNFVATHSRCNNRKSDRLAAQTHLDRWVGSLESHGDDLATALGGQGILSDVSSSLRIARWAYRQTYDADGLTWLKNDELLPLDEGWNASLDRLLRQ